MPAARVTIILAAKVVANRGANTIISVCWRCTSAPYTFAVWRNPHRLAQKSHRTPSCHNFTTIDYMKANKQYNGKMGSTKDDGWLIVGSKKAKASKFGTAAAPKSASKPYSANNQGGLGNNKYFLPKMLETELHKPTDPHIEDTKQTAAHHGPEVVEQRQKENHSFLSIMGLTTDESNHHEDPTPGPVKKRKLRGPKRRKNQLADDVMTANAKGPYSPSPKTLQGDEDGYTMVGPRKGQRTRRPNTTDKRNLLLRRIADAENILLDLPSDVLSRIILRFLEPKDLLSLGSC